MLLNKYDYNAIAELIIAKSAIANVKVELDFHGIKGSEYKINALKKIEKESIVEAEKLTKVINKCIDKIGRKIVTLINKATRHINEADISIKKDLKSTTNDIANICEKKVLSVLTIAQSSLINADRILSKSLDKSKSKDMITRDTIQDILDTIEACLDWIDNKFDYLSKFTDKTEFELIMTRASNYLAIVDRENCLI